MQDKELAFPLNEFVQCTEQEYFSAPGINAHGLMMIHKKSPKHYKYYYLDGNEKETTPAMELGKLTHKAIFERELFLKNYRPEPDLDKRTIDGKAQYKQWQDSLSPDSIVLKLKDAEKLMGMISAVYELPAREKMLAKGKSEVSIWTRDEAGILLKARLDFVNDDGVVVDLKTSTTAHPIEFMNKAHGFSYEIQTAWYLHVLRTAFKKEFMFAWLVVESGPPYVAETMSPDQPSLDQALRDALKALEKYKQCLQNNVWPGYSKAGEVMTVSTPYWGMNYYED